MCKELKKVEAVVGTPNGAEVEGVVRGYNYYYTAYSVVDGSLERREIPGLFGLSLDNIVPNRELLIRAEDRGILKPFRDELYYAVYEIAKYVCDGVRDRTVYELSSYINNCNDQNCFDYKSIFRSYIYFLMMRRFLGLSNMGHKLTLETWGIQMDLFNSEIKAPICDTPIYASLFGAPGILQFRLGQHIISLLNNYQNVVTGVDLHFTLDKLTAMLHNLEMMLTIAETLDAVDWDALLDYYCDIDNFVIVDDDDEY